jgi:transposase-like protein
MSILFPFDKLLDEVKIYQWFEKLLWPEGPTCPHCKGREDLRVHSHRREPMLDWRCRRCKRVFNLFTGTVFRGTHHSLTTLFAIVRGLAQGVSTQQLHKEVGVKYEHLLNLRHKIQDWVMKTVMRDPVVKSQVTEADEMYQNAGEKRKKARRPRRSAASARK